MDKDAYIKQLEAENAALKQHIKTLEKRIEQMQKHIDNLVRRLGMNSQNSSKPPSSDPPVAAENPFLPTGNSLHPPYDMSDSELPSDHYLWLVGQGGRMLRGERAPTVNMPVRSGR